MLLKPPCRFIFADDIEELFLLKSVSSGKMLVSIGHDRDFVTMR